MADHYLTNDREPDAYKLFQRLVGTSIAQPRDYAVLEYFDRQLPENERPTRPYEHTTEYALEKFVANYDWIYIYLYPLRALIGFSLIELLSSVIILE